MSGTWTAWAKGALGRRGTAQARLVAKGLPRPRWGNLRRLSPLSDSFGFDRGTPIDRFYLERFLAAESSAITGRVLEVQVPSYTKRFGRDVVVSETVDIEDRFHPTFVCDLAKAEGVIADAAYDCVLLPNTLQHLRDLDPALNNAVRVLKPGGTLLASAAGLLRLTQADQDFWRLSPEGWRIVASRVWRDCEVDVRGWGNCLAAVAALYGLALEELSQAELEFHDERFPVLTTIRCRRPR
jgi:SAM-dependent methyltransferase